MAFKVGVFTGSLSKDSINRKLAKALFRPESESLEPTEIPIEDLPLYNDLVSAEVWAKV